MPGPTRGFLGRRRDRDPRLPPGQYDTGATGRCSPPRPRRASTPETWTFTVDGLVEHADAPGPGTRSHALPRVGVRAATSTA